MDVRDIQISDYDYLLPESRIARHPLEERDACRLLVARGTHTEHRKFNELPDILPPGTLMVRNNTRVIHARLPFHKATGAAIEIFLLEPVVPVDYAEAFGSKTGCVWNCLVGNLKKWKEGRVELTVGDAGEQFTLIAEKVEDGVKGSDGSLNIRFAWTDATLSFAEVVERAGRIPIPPYLNRESEQSDTIDYQTVYAAIDGSVAAPTAGLHFTPRLFAELESKGVEVAEVTLHVGAGTFKPVKSVSIGEHDMHTETFVVTGQMLRSVISALEDGRPVVAVGTTSVRTLESLPYLAMNVACGKEWHVEQWQAYTTPVKDKEECVALLKSLLNAVEQDGLESRTASTAIMIAPGFEWNVVKGMVTNFHQPCSTLLLLVSSFLGGDVWRFVYAEAMREGYRFLSYGDACLFLK